MGPLSAFSCVAVVGVTELARLKALVPSSGLISAATIDSEASALQSRIEQLATAR